MSTKVGEGYIEIEPRVDRKQVRAFTQQQAAMFDGLAKKARKSIEESDKQFTVSNNKRLAAFQALDRQRQKSLADEKRGRMDQLKAATAGLKSAQMLEKQRQKAIRDTEAESTRVAKASAKERVVVHSRANERIKVNVDKDSDTWGRIMGKNILHGVDAGMSILPGRLESLFTKSGPVIGGALALAVVSGFMIALPALGAMISGALFAGLGIATVAAAVVVGVLDDQRVKDAGSRFVNVFKESVLYAEQTQIIGERLAKAIDIATERLQVWAPLLGDILVRSSEFFDDFAVGISDAIGRLIPSFDRLMDSDFMAKLLETTLNGLVKIADAFGDGMDNFLTDPTAQDGAIKGLDDLFDLVAGSIRTIMELLKDLSSAWSELNEDPDGPGPMNSQLDNMKQNLVNIIDLFKKLGGVLPKSPLETEKDDNTVRGEIKRGEAPEGAKLWRKLLPPVAAVDMWNAGMFDPIRARLKDFWRDFSAEWAANWDRFIVGSGITWTRIKDTFSTGTANVGTTTASFWERLKLGSQLTANNIVGAFSTAWTLIQMYTTTQWTMISGVLSFIWTELILKATASTDQIAAAFHWGWQRVHDGSIATWNAIVGFVEGAWGRLVAGSGATTANIEAIFTGAWDRMKLGSQATWENIASLTEGAWDRLVIGSQLTVDKILGIFRTAYNKLVTGVFESVLAVIDVINKGIKAINEILDKLKVPQDKRLSEIAPPGAPAPVPFATGGRVKGPGTGTSDSVPAVLSNGEFVVKSSAARKLGYQNLAYMNAMGRLPGFAAGGRVGAHNEGLLQQHANHLHVAMLSGWQNIVALAAQSGIPFTVGSTTRPGDRVASGGLSHHSGGNAVDFMGFHQDALASFFAGVPGVVELIHRTGIQDYTIFGGKAGPGGGGISGILLDVLTGGIGKLLDPIINTMRDGMGDSLFGTIAGSSLDLIKGGVTGWVDEFMKSFRELIPGGGGGASLGGNISAIAGSALSHLGLPGSWLGPLLQLIDRESGGNPNAINNWDSNAAMGQPSQGLMQTIPSTFAAYRDPRIPGGITDPMANIVAGLRYIQSRYGSIFNVQQAVGSSPKGYDSGGWMNPGWGSHYNGTSRPEAVLTGSQWAAVESGGMSGDINMKVYIDGVEVAGQVAVERNNEEIIVALRSGRGRA